MIAWKERMKDGRHVGLDFYDLLIEPILPINRTVRLSANAHATRSVTSAQLASGSATSYTGAVLQRRHAPGGRRS